MSPNVETVDRLIRRDHADVCRSIADCADAVADGWTGGAVSRRDAVVDPLERELRNAGVLERLSTLLADGVSAIGGELPADPVAAPPYVVVTSRGPVARATIDPGRLVVEFVVFDVDGSPPRYRRLEAGSVDVTVEVL